MAYAVFVLKGQTKNQVMTYGGIANLLRFAVYMRHLLKGLNAIDGLLDHGIVILNPEAVPSRSQIVQHLQLLVGGVIRMSLVAQLKIVRFIGMFKYAVDQALKIVGREKRWCASTKVYIVNSWPFIKQIQKV